MMTLNSGNTPSGDELAVIRHEMRTPLAAVIGYCELLLDAARERGLGSLLPQLNEIHRAGRLALNHVKELVQAEVFGAGASWEDLRDRVREPLEVALERSAELLPDARRRAPEMVGDLARIQAACGHLRRRIWGLAGDVDPGGPEDAAVPSWKPHERSESRADRGSVLVVDDHQPNRDLVARMLEKQGYRVVTAESGPVALEELATDGAIDLVLLDVLMPGMDGYEVLSKIKRDEALRGVPVILVSALDEMKHVVEGLRLGAEDYLPRPFDPAVLMTRVETAIEQKRLQEKTALYDDDPGELGKSFRRMAVEIHRREERLKRQARD